MVVGVRVSFRVIGRTSNVFVKFYTFKKFNRAFSFTDSWRNSKCRLDSMNEVDCIGPMLFHPRT